MGIAKWVKPQDKVWVSGEERLPVVPGESCSAPRWELCFGGCCEECEKLNLLLRRGCPSCRLPGVQMVARVGFVHEIGSSFCQAVWERGGCSSRG